MYDHLNNAVYITYFDAIINEYLCRVGGLVPQSTDSPIGLVVSSSFSYAAALEFPAPLLAGLSVTKLGRSSVRYAVALFSAEAVARTSSLEAATATGNGKHADFSFTLRMRSTAAAAYGEMTHVFVDPKTRRPTDMAPRMRAELEKLVLP